MGDSSIGIFNGKKVFSPKQITAEIMDSSNNLFFVPLVNLLGDFFLWEDLQKQVYCFKLDGTRIKTSKAKGARSFQVVHYDTSHYLPISQSDIKYMEIVLNKNHLPKIDRKLANILNILGRTEKEDFTIHDITQTVEKAFNNEKRLSNEYKQEIMELINFMASLDTDRIITPVKRLSDFIQHDLKTADARILGEMFTQAANTEKKVNKILNPTLTAKRSWLVMILAMGLVVMVVALLYVANDAGYFENVGSMVPGMSGIGSGAGYDQATLMKQYPNCPALKSAVESGKLDYNRLPKDVQKIADSCPTPVATPQIKVPSQQSLPADPEPQPVPDTGK